MNKTDLWFLMNRPGDGACQSCGHKRSDPSIYCWECNAHLWAKRTLQRDRALLVLCVLCGTLMAIVLMGG